MSVSIYYSFKNKKNLEKQGYLKKVEDQWNKAFEGNPYEDWCWYKPEIEKSFFSKVFKYEGALKMPLNDERETFESIYKAVAFLSAIRNQVGGNDWSVQLDDRVIEWDTELMEFNLDK